MEEEIRPVVKQVLLSYAAAYLLVLATLMPLLWLLRLPPPIFSAIVMLLLTADSVFMVYRAARAYWVHITERYVVGDDYIMIQRGWASKTSGLVQSQNISEAKAVMPLFLRTLGVGFIVIDTNDGNRHVLHNVNDPVRIAGSINRRGSLPRVHQLGSP